MFMYTLLGLSSRLPHWNHRDPAPVLEDDGACPVCDHPFGDFSHMCIGAATHLAA